jgi:hypothetical protein
MNLNGTSRFVTAGASEALVGAMFTFPVIKAVVLRPLAHLIIWVGEEQRERE